MNVLILEDDDLVAQGLVRAFGYVGCRGLHVRDVQEAQSIVERDGIALAMIDVGLDDGQSGEDFLRWLRDEHPEVSRVLISGLARPLGFVDDPPHQLFLRKPFGQRELEALVSALQPQKPEGGTT